MEPHLILWILLNIQNIIILGQLMYEAQMSAKQTAELTLFDLSPGDPLRWFHKNVQYENTV